jgi:signal transduction histidine kinase
MHWPKHPMCTRFSGLCLAGVVTLALMMGLTLSSLLTRAVAEWEWQNTAALVTREVTQGGLEGIFSEPSRARAQAHWGPALSRALTTLPEVVRVKVWSPAMEVLWSDSSELVGQRFPGNQELREALAGKVEVEIKQLGKSEQRYEQRAFDTLAEVYVPIFAHDGRVLGVVEVYKTPERLLTTIRWSRIVIGAISLVGGAMLYAVLLPLLTQVYRRQVEEEMLRRHAERLETEVEERTQQFMQVQKMQAIGLLAGGIAHDFNNLLTVISGRAQILLHHVRADATVRQNAEAIQDSAERAVSLTRQLLAFSRKQVLERRAVDLNAVIVDMAGMLQRLIGEHIVVSTTLARSAAYVSADRAQIEQMILNLAINARDAMLQGGRLTLTVDTVESDGSPTAVAALPAGCFVQLAVSDTGTGMDEATKSRIFEPFFTTKGVGQGTGLGLFTVYGVVEQHEGRIVVESERGKGTTFTVYIPQSDDPMPAAAGTPGVARVGSETIMVVEDDDAVRELATHFLLEHGYTVLAAGDGEEALAVAERHRGPIHVLLTDVVMPRLSGWQLAPQFAGLHPEARVLYMTGYTEVPALPGVRVLQKPFTAFSLPQAVRELVDAEPRPSSRLVTAAS